MIQPTADPGPIARDNIKLDGARTPLILLHSGYPPRNQTRKSRAELYIPFGLSCSSVVMPHVLETFAHAGVSQ